MANKERSNSSCGSSQKKKSQPVHRSHTGGLEGEQSRTPSPTKSKLNFLEGFRNTLRARSPVRNNSTAVSDAQREIYSSTMVLFILHLIFSFLLLEEYMLMIMRMPLPTANLLLSTPLFFTRAWMTCSEGIFFYSQFDNAKHFRRIILLFDDETKLVYSSNKGTLLLPLLLDA